MICLVLFDLTCRTALPLEVLALRWRAARAATDYGPVWVPCSRLSMATIQARGRRQSFGAPSVAQRPWPRQREDRTKPGASGQDIATGMVSRYRDEVSAPEYIGCKKRTQGTETSKYLQERTSTETPQVVASERGPGQWQC